MKQQLLKEATQKVVAPAKPSLVPREKRDEVLDGIANDCVVKSKAYIDQSMAPEGE